MSRYTKEHYEEIAKVLRKPREDGLKALGQNQGSTAIACVMLDFADLFAADNPDSVYCGYCGTVSKSTFDLCPERRPGEIHSFFHDKGFDRDKFLKACGLEPAQNTVLHGPSLNIPNEGGTP